MAIQTNMRKRSSIILETDTAITGPAGCWAKYIEAGFDESLLKLEGSPTRFDVQRMTYDQRQHAIDIMSAGERMEFIVRCILLGVKGYEVLHENGSVTGLPKVEFEESQEWDRPIVTRTWMQSTGFPLRVLKSLSAVGLMLAEGAVPFFKPSAPPSTATDTAEEQPPAERPAN